MNGDSEQVGEIRYDARIDTSKLAADGKRAEAAVRGAAGGAESAVSKSSRNMSASLDGAAASVAALGGAYMAAQGLKNFLTDSIDEANRMQSSMIGLTTISNAYGQSAVNARTAAKELAADGLMSVTEAATGLKNLLASGFSLDQAITLMQRFKDTAAFGRQSALSFGDAISSATEGIKNGNSILVDNAGVTKNLSVILEEHGKSQQDVMNITSDASVRQALYNGLLKETSAQLGDASRLAGTAAGADAALGVQTQYLEAKVGTLANTIRQPLVMGLTQFIAGNQQTIMSVGAGIAAFGAFTLGTYGVIKAMALLRVAILAVNPVIAVISVALGFLASDLVSHLVDNMGAAGNSMDDFGGSTGAAADQVGGLSKQAEKLQEQLASIDDQIAKTNRDFRENLKQMVLDHQKAVKDLTRQISDNNAEYQKAYNDRLASFTDEQDKETASHEEKTAKLQAQIDFLRRYNNASNRQQLSELQFALAKENAQYSKKLADRKAQYEQDAAAEKKSFDDKQSALAKQLEDEQNLLKKHAADVRAVRNVNLLDEIDKAKRARDEQLKSLNQQRRDALKNASNTASGVGATYGKLGKDLKTSMGKVGDSVGTEMGKAFKKELEKALQQMWHDLVDFANHNPFQKWLDDKGKEFGHFANHNPVQKFFSDSGRDFGNWLRGHRAMGGPVSAGMAYAVGDNPDGSWNKTTELFVPKQSGTIIPADEVQRMTRGGGSQSVQISVNLSGVMTSSRAEERALAKRLIEAFNEGLRAKGLPEIGAAA